MSGEGCKNGGRGRAEGARQDRRWASEGGAASREANGAWCGHRRQTGRAGVGMSHQQIGRPRRKP
eukprot:4474749-Pleurochrysis_carterae.AAC.1